MPRRPRSAGVTATRGSSRSAARRSTPRPTGSRSRPRWSRSGRSWSRPSAPALRRPASGPWTRPSGTAVTSTTGSTRSRPSSTGTSATCTSRTLGSPRPTRTRSRVSRSTSGTRSTRTPIGPRLRADHDSGRYRSESRPVSPGCASGDLVAELRQGPDVAAGRAEGPEDLLPVTLGDLALDRPAVHEPVHVGALDDKRVEVGGKGLDGLGRADGRRLLEERDEVGVSGTDGERCCRQGLLELGRSPDEGRALEAELTLEGLLEVLLDGGAGAFRVEDDVAAVDVCPHVVVAEALGDPFEPRHLDLPLAEVHRAQEADPDRHGRTLAPPRLLRRRVRHAGSAPPPGEPTHHD